MSGHSHWSGIKHKKGIVDAKRGKLFSKLAKDITVAARMGGADADMNLRLKYAVEKARDANMPKDNIERAIKKGTGELSGGQLDECVYEGYGVGGVAVMVQALTDNRNRTSGEIRKIFEVNGGRMGKSGCVSRLFQKKGLFTVSTATISEEDLLSVALESGADDLTNLGEAYEITCTVESFADVTAALEEHGITCDVAEIADVPQTYVDLDAKSARKVLKMMEALEDQDDAQSVSANLNIPEELVREEA